MLLLIIKVTVKTKLHLPSKVAQAAFLQPILCMRFSVLVLLAVVIVFFCSLGIGGPFWKSLSLRDLLKTKAVHQQLPLSHFIIAVKVARVLHVRQNRWTCSSGLDHWHCCCICALIFSPLTPV